MESSSFLILAYPGDGTAPREYRSFLACETEDASLSDGDGTTIRTCEVVMTGEYRGSRLPMGISYKSGGVEMNNTGGCLILAGTLGDVRRVYMDIVKPNDQSRM